MGDVEPTPEERQANISKALAEARKAEAEAAKAEAEAAMLVSEEARRQELHQVALSNNQIAVAEAREKLRVNEIMRQREERKEKAILADDSYNHVYIFDSGVDASSVETCIAQLTRWMRNDPGCKIEIVFDSPGGSVIDGMHLMDFIAMLQRQGHHITTMTLGMAASMAGILLQAGDVRAMGREAYLLVHQISFTARGKMGEIEDEVAFSHKIQDRILNIFAKRTAATLAARAGTEVTPTMVRKQRKIFEEGWNRKDWWLDSDEAYALGLVDEIR